MENTSFYLDEDKRKLINQRMEEVRRYREELKKKFKALLEEYSYTQIINIDTFENAFQLLCVEHLSVFECYIDNELLELAKMMRFYLQIDKTSCVLSGTIKGQSIKTNFSEPIITDLFIHTERTLFEKIYRRIPDYKDIAEVRNNGGLEKGIFEVEELNKLIEFLEFCKKIEKWGFNLKMAHKISQLLCDIESIGIKEKGQTKLYSFVYDLLILRKEGISMGNEYRGFEDIGSGFSGIIGKEKKDKIKYSLKTKNIRNKKIEESESTFKKFLKEKLVEIYVLGNITEKD